VRDGVLGSRPVPDFDNVILETTANIYFDHKCVNPTFFLAGETKKSASVILPRTRWMTNEPLRPRQKLAIKHSTRKARASA